MYCSRQIHILKPSLSLATVFEKIKELGQFSTLSKHEHIVDGLIHAIDEQLLERGDQLPSINKMSEEIGYARKTIVKAYEDLKARGIVESKNYIGYFVASTVTTQKLKVALLLYAFHAFQESFYNALRDEISEGVQLDVFFHHNNPEIFSAIVDNIARKYGKYIIAPIESASTIETLKQIPPQNLIIADRFVDFGTKCCYVVQEFEQATLNTLRELKPSISRFNKFMLFFNDNADYPVGVKNAFLSFVEEESIPHEVANAYRQKFLKKGMVYLLINDNELWELLKDCKAAGLTPGIDVGILSHNDSAVKELVEGGITTFSTDFKTMGRIVAQSLYKEEVFKKVIPTSLIKRQTL